MSRRRVQTIILAACGLAVVTAFIPLTAIGASPAIEAEYHSRSQKLAPDDLQGHLDLALWCREKQAWDLLAEECEYILSTDKGKDSRQAQLLLELAKTKLASQPAATSTTQQPQGATGKQGQAGKPALLTDEQVQILKRAEIKVDSREPVGRIRAEFKNDVLKRFWNEYSTTRTLSRDAWADFLKSSPGVKVLTILAEVRAGRVSPSLADDIIITSDPIIFEEFIRRVEPIILSGCATSKCHGGTEAGDFALYNERVMKENTHYTNFLILEQYKHDDLSMINRDFPEQSLVVQYGLPPDAQNVAHPTQIDTLYRSPDDPRLAIVLRWIGALDLPAPEYGITLEPATPKP